MLELFGQKTFQSFLGTGLIIVQNLLSHYNKHNRQKTIIMKSNLYYTPIRNFSDSSLTLSSLKRFSFVRFLSKPAFKWTLLSILIAMLLIFISTDDAKAQCSVNITMNDSYGDGWNGGYLTIYFDGISQGTYSATGYGSTASLTIPSGSFMEVTYTSGSWESENTYSIVIGGSTVFSDGTNPSTGTVYSYTCLGGGSTCDYSVPYSGNNSITASSGFICDEYGWGTNYVNNANGYTVINPVSAGDMVSLTFTNFELEGCCDYVRVFDGTGTGGTELWSGNGTSLPPNVTSTTGPLTIQFTSDGSVTYKGFRAEISNLGAPGDELINPISIGSLDSYGCGSSYTTSINTTAFSNTTGNSSPDIFYSFSISNAGTVNINTCTGSDFDTYLRLYDSGQNEIYSNDDACGLQSEIEETLSAGTYYVCVEGFSSSSGTAGLELSLINPQGDCISNPLAIGTLNGNYDCGSTYTEAVVTSNFTNTQDNTSPDVFHSFTLTSEALVNINTCTGSNFDTYLRLFDSGQSQIYANDDACGVQSEIEETLPAGTYYIQTEGYSSNSGTAGLEVYIVPESPIISGQPSDASICEGDNTNLSIVSDCGACTCTYQWQEYNGSWTDIGGATNDTYNASPTSTTDYRCIVTNGGLSTTSDVATVTVNPYPTNVNAGSDLMVCSGGSVQLNGSADGTSVSFSWSPSASLDNANIANPNASPAAATTYTMTASINGCSVQDDVYVDLYDGTWTGIEDNNWHNPNNWCNGIPSSTDDAVISSNATNMPEIHFATANVRNLTVLSGASIEINSDQILNIYGDFINQGTLSMSNGNEAIVMQGNNININTNGNAVNHLHVQGSSTIVNIQNSFDINGELNIQAGSLNLGNHTIQVAGNITVDGNLNAGTSTVVLNGTSVQTLNTNGNNAIFNNLTVNNTTANLSEIVLDSDLHISGHLELTEGIIFTNIAAHKVKLLDGASSSNGNANSFVDGEVEKTGTTAFIYPVGDVANIGGSDRGIWAPIETDACALSTISANYYYENPPYDWWYHGGNMDASIDHVTDREYWDLSTNNATPAVSIYWTDNTDDLHSFGSTSGELTPAFLASNMTIAHYNTGLNKWEDMGASIPTGTIYFDDGVIKTTTAFSSYSPITFASKNPTFTLPVELITFNANCYDDYVSINWTSASEINNDYYLVERSEDGKNWESIARVEGAGNSNTEIDYEVIDDNPLNGNNYYRLTQFDFDGKFETFKTVITTCDMEENELEIVVYPNPFKNELNLTAFNSDDSQSYTVRLLDISGKLILEREIQSVSNAFHIRLLPGDIKTGMYILEVLSESEATRFKVQRM